MIELQPKKQYMVKYRDQYELAVFVGVLVRKGRVALKFMHVETGENLYVDIDFDGDIKEEI